MLLCNNKSTHLWKLKNHSNPIAQNQQSHITLQTMPNKTTSITETFLSKKKKRGKRRKDIYNWVLREGNWRNSRLEWSAWGVSNACLWLGLSGTSRTFGFAWNSGESVTLSPLQPLQPPLLLFLRCPKAFSLYPETQKGSLLWNPSFGRFRKRNAEIYAVSAVRIAGQ